ncbi:hypothetical protein AADG42_01995 [Ammonicoccus fulvus]
MTSGFGFDSPFDDLINQFFGGRDPFSLLGARQTTAPSMQRVDLSRSLSAEARALISRAAA